MDKQDKILKEITQELFDLLQMKVNFTIKKEEDVFIIQFKTDEPGVLIGYHGQALAALQQMITMIAFKKLGEWVRILVDVEDYREKRKEVLERMTMNMAEKVKVSGQSQILPPMSSFERRIVHLVLANHSEVETVSEGEGEQRHVVIKRKA
ncbi:MAG: KH domain-containing protein [Candidatus Shapirobacteria bacterium]|nr:KH domain-containing protein [Candidatus Shapirobacteria bacterium]